MLIDDLYTYHTKSDQMGGSPNCRLCPDMMAENTYHILAMCSAYSDIREKRILRNILTFARKLLLGDFQ